MKQSTALQVIKLGHTTFLTGEAGAGKSYVLRQFIEWLKDHDIRYSACATTGIAATHIKGQTLHSFTGLGVRDDVDEYTCDKILQKKPVYDKLSRLQVLIIDEVSMLPKGLLDSVDMILRRAKRNALPFGGVQVVFCGDFFQLPPIGKQGDLQTPYAFYADSWKKSKPVVCYITEQHRQVGDVLTDILTSIRNQSMEEGLFESIQERMNATIEEPYTKLYTHNIDVDAINNKALEKLDSPEETFFMSTKGSTKRVEMLMKNCLAPEELRLKKGAAVMFVKNDKEKKFVNGTLGEVISFHKEGHPIVRTTDGREITVIQDSWQFEDDGTIKAEITQYPLKLAWAITVHKSQGMTLDRAEIDISKAFSFGMGYVALSRLRSLNGLSLKGVSNQAFMMHPDVIGMDENFRKQSAKANTSLTKYDENQLQELVQANIIERGGSILKLSKEEKSKKEKAESGPSTYELTRDMLSEKTPLDQIVASRGIAINTILDHIDQLAELGELPDINYLLPKKSTLEKISKAFDEAGMEKLKPAFENLKGVYDYHELKLVRAHKKSTEK